MSDKIYYVNFWAFLRIKASFPRGDTKKTNHKQQLTQNQNPPFPISYITPSLRTPQNKNYVNFDKMPWCEILSRGRPCETDCSKMYVLTTES